VLLLQLLLLLLLLLLLPVLQLSRLRGGRQQRVQQPVVLQRRWRGCRGAAESGQGPGPAANVVEHAAKREARELDVATPTH